MAAVTRWTGIDRIDLDEAGVSQTSFLDLIVDSLQVKDPYTFDHGRSVRGLAGAVGEMLGLRALNLWRLSEAAFFHDIGKVCIPSDILQKRGPLTSSERVVMDTHAELGQQLLEHVPGYEEVAVIVRSCHESFDGSGYPDGLSGEDIPIEARIITVVDAYDALASRRTYKEPVPEAEARMSVASSAGTKYDPRVVAAFLEVMAGLAAR